MERAILPTTGETVATLNLSEEQGQPVRITSGTFEYVMGNESLYIVPSIMQQ